MIRTEDYIRYANVFSDKQTFHYADMGKELEEFIKRVEKTGGKKAGPLFYAMHNIPLDENVNMEFFMPMQEENLKAADLKFSSYYSVEHMISTYVFGNYETQMEVAYSALIEFMKKYQLDPITPFFHVVDRERRYIKK